MLFMFVSEIFRGFEIAKSGITWHFIDIDFDNSDIFMYVDFDKIADFLPFVSLKTCFWSLILENKLQSSIWCTFQYDMVAKLIYRLINVYQMLFCFFFKSMFFCRILQNAKTFFSL